MNRQLSHTFYTFPKAKMADYTRTTIKLPQEVTLSLDQQLTRQHAGIPNFIDPREVMIVWGGYASTF